MIMSDLAIDALKSPRRRVFVAIRRELRAFCDHNDGASGSAAIAKLELIVATSMCVCVRAPLGTGICACACVLCCP